MLQRRLQVLNSIREDKSLTKSKYKKAETIKRGYSYFLGLDKWEDLQWEIDSFNTKNLSIKQEISYENGEE